MTATLAAALALVAGLYVGVVAGARYARAGAVLDRLVEAAELHAEINDAADMAQTGDEREVALDEPSP